jgi:hypothetical protein
MLDIAHRMARIPRPISQAETEAFWYWANQVEPDDGVLATYEVTAPFSCRECLYSYIMDQNKPKDWPRLGPEFQWVFLRRQDLDPSVFLARGFNLVHKGEFLTILRRPRDAGAMAH